ncbi:hypothetical protein AB1L42_00510 [Thalassoglobus sp. JC818]|uniref:hypothetical protein n=1 Tax=Thalassoglobus sp. JC818 TaxID=3232136 RepID=UPI003458AA6D
MNHVRAGKLCICRITGWEFPHGNGSETDMHEYVVNLSHVKNIWSIVEEIDECESQRLIDVARIRSAELLNKADKNMSDVERMDVENVKSLCRLPDKTLLEASTNIISDVINFSEDVMKIFKSVLSTRELTGKEQQVGIMLNELLDQVLKISGRNTRNKG